MSCTKNSEKKIESINSIKEDLIDYSITSFSEIPKKIDGCACYFYLSKEDKDQGKFIYINDLAEKGYIYINKELQEFVMTEFVDSPKKKYVYKNKNYQMNIDVISEIDLPEEKEITAELTLIKGKQILKKKIIGSCGC